MEKTKNLLSIKLKKSEGQKLFVVVSKKTATLSSQRNLIRRKIKGVFNRSKDFLLPKTHIFVYALPGSLSLSSQKIEGIIKDKIKT